MAWSINNIENQVSNIEGAYTLTYSIEGIPTIKKHELSTNEGVFYKEITPVGNLTGFSVNIEATSELKNCYIRCTDSEGNVQTSNLFTLQFVSPSKKNPPKIQNIKIQNVNQSGVYQIVYEATDDNGNDNLTHYLKIDNDSYKQISPTKSENNFTYNGTGLSNGTHVCNIKVSNGTLEVESTVFQIIIPNIVNNPPTISNVTVEETSYKGRYRISYTAKDTDTADLIIHKLKIDEADYEIIKPISVDDKYVYNGLGLSQGTHEGIVQISDGTNEVQSNPFSIVINAQEGVGLKQQLAEAKVDYDSSYTSLMDTVKDVINKMTNDKQYDNNIGAELVSNAYKNYTDKSVKLKEISQKAIDLIGDKKTSDAKENLAKEIGDLTNSLGSLDSSMNDVFKDGILTEAEKITIRQHLQSLSLEKVDVDNQYNSILGKFNKTDLEYAEKGTAPPITVGNTNTDYPDKKWYLKLYNDFKNAYANYSKKYENLILIIDYILKKDGILDSTDKDKKDKAFQEYILAIGEYSKQASLAIEGIGRNETENNETLVQTFKGEYVRTNKENSAKLTALTQTTNGLTEQVSEFKQTADRIQTQVTQNSSKLGQQQSTITQLSNQIKSKVSAGDVTSIIEQNPNSIVWGLNHYGRKGTWVTVRDGYVTFENCKVSCSAITSLPDDDPIIYLYGDKNKGRCSIDATQNDEEGTGDAIRLKWDRSNYVRIAENRISFYEKCYGRSAIFNVDDKGVYYRGKRIDNQTPSIPSMLNTLSSICKAQTGTWAQFSPKTDGNVFCGASGARWDTVFSKSGVKTTSDRREKEKITYIENNNPYRTRLMKRSDDALKDDNDNVYDVSPEIIEKDLYDFIKDDLHLATYRFKSVNTEIPQDSQIGFIAQDIEHTKLGEYIIDGDSEKGDNLMVRESNYINTIAGALKFAINKIERLEEEIIELQNRGE